MVLNFLCKGTRDTNTCKQTNKSEDVSPSPVVLRFSEKLDEGLDCFKNAVAVQSMEKEKYVWVWEMEHEYKVGKERPCPIVQTCHQTHFCLYGKGGEEERTIANLVVCGAKPVCLSHYI